MYTSCVECSSQFRFCGNPFRIDLYKGCTYGCKYCFANSSIASNHNDGADLADFDTIEKLFHKALDTDDKTVDAKVELLRHHVPLHCGGMSDPFQHREFKDHLTYKLIELTNKYHYPITFSTKTCNLPDEYWDILDPEIHAFQISIMGYDDDFIKKYELNTPTAKERVAFLQKLRSKGFWCSIRIQPLIDLAQAIKLIEHSCSAVDESLRPSYITVEHLKIPNDNIEVKKLFSEEYKSGSFYKSKSNFRNIEMIPSVKKKNFEEVTTHANAYGVLVGCGDNDLHYLSQSRCCCGVDTINDNFNDYLKYNLTYFITGDFDIDKLFKPQGSYNTYLNSSVRNANPTIKTFAGWVDKYVKDNADYVYASGRLKILDDLGIPKQTKLF